MNRGVSFIQDKEKYLHKSVFPRRLAKQFLVPLGENYLLSEYLHSFIHAYHWPSIAVYPVSNSTFPALHGYFYWFDIKRWETVLATFIGGGIWWSTVFAQFDIKQLSSASLSLPLSLRLLRYTKIAALCRKSSIIEGIQYYIVKLLRSLRHIWVLLLAIHFLAFRIVLSVCPHYFVIRAAACWEDKRWCL